MANGAITITLTAGTATFVNKWYQTHQADWRIPVATVILAAGTGGLASLDNKAGLLLAWLVMLGAVTTKFNGKSVIDTIGDVSRKSPAPRPPGQQATRKP